MPSDTPAERAKNVADPSRPARLRRQGIVPPARQPLPTQAAPRAAEAQAAPRPAQANRANAQGRRDALRRRLR